MEIIGKNDNGFILTASKDELEQLDNLYYGKGRYFINTEINVHDMYNQVKFLNKHKEEIAIVQKSLQRIIDNLTLINPFIVPNDRDET